MELVVDALFAFQNLCLVELFNRVFFAFDVGDLLGDFLSMRFKVGNLVVASFDCATLGKTG